ncbi:GntR family transcriptional regulator [Curtobacterium sp. MCBD17_021]|uniref:GntR family transcriptional regulator n=1 Tax=Curtobacterium sp. MCBD17_021 TaxID=2175665 RepID=UPI000DAAC980|nr:GntR family transcriptional regulator [Curtobacterium sp. MCBD17_021]PZE67046.1 hypothetical protein DEI83_07085 [Curtobacterium sp. MCBD17_021]
MPVPNVTSNDGPVGRVLLRDLAFDALLEAIREGVLHPAERLLDVELSGWLGMSRTPIREALARLEDIGLVETSANRYTRVATVSAIEHAHAAEVLELLCTCAANGDGGRGGELSKRDRALASDLIDGLQTHDVAAYRALLDLRGTWIASFGNPLLSDAERGLRLRAQFHAVAEGVLIDWSRLTQVAERMARGAAHGYC